MYQLAVFRSSLRSNFTSAILSRVYGSLVYGNQALFLDVFDVQDFDVRHTIGIVF